MMTLEQIETCSLGELYSFALYGFPKDGELIRAALERAYYIGHSDGLAASSQSRRRLVQDVYEILDLSESVVSTPPARTNEGEVE